MKVFCGSGGHTKLLLHQPILNSLPLPRIIHYTPIIFSASCFSVFTLLDLADLLAPSRRSDIFVLVLEPEEEWNSEGGKQVGGGLVVVGRGGVLVDMLAGKAWEGGVGRVDICRPVGWRGTGGCVEGMSGVSLGCS